MSGAQHTPGPWEIIASHTGDFYIASTAAIEEECVAEVYAGTLAPADASLIAAAPDLLKALQEAVESLEQTLRWNFGWECSEDELLGTARAAISKALGQTPRGEKADV